MSPTVSIPCGRLDAFTVVSLLVFLLRHSRPDDFTPVCLSPILLHLSRPTLDTPIRLAGCFTLVSTCLFACSPLLAKLFYTCLPLLSLLVSLLVALTPLCGQHHQPKDAKEERRHAPGIHKLSSGLFLQTSWSTTSMFLIEVYCPWKNAIKARRKTAQRAGRWPSGRLRDAMFEESAVSKLRSGFNDRFGTNHGDCSLEGRPGILTRTHVRLNATSSLKEKMFWKS